MPRKVKDTVGGKEVAREILLQLAESTAGLTGEAFFEGLTRQLAQVLGVRYACITEQLLATPDTLRTLSFWGGESWLTNFDYALRLTPCAEVVSAGRYFCPRNTQARFPEDRDLSQLHIESYFGLRLCARDGSTLGHLCVMDVQPMDDERWLTSILEVFAARAAAEIERLRADHAMRESEQRFRQLAENLPGIVFSYLKDAAGHRQLRYLGPGARRLLGEELHAQVATNIDMLFESILPEDRAALLAESDLAAEQQLLLHREFRAQLPDGKHWFEVFARSTPQDEAGQLWTGTVFDISARKEAEAQLREYSRALEESNATLQEVSEKARAATRTKTEFLANMSHEIRTPMTAILGYADILGERIEDPEDREALGIIREHGRYLLQIINDILDLSTIEAGRLELNFRRVSVFQLLHHVQELMRVRAHEKGLSLTVEYPERMPAVVRTDPVRLRQILINLLSNAIKFTERGGVRIRVEYHDHPGLPVLEFEIRDTGVGMSEAKLAALFEPFTQVDGTARRRYGGAGLGLSISRRLAEMLGGTISVESQEGKGSSFRVVVATGLMDDLRMISAEEGLAFLKAPEEPLMGPERLNLRILLAEDNRTNQRLVRHVLEKLGAWVGVAENGREAVDTALAARERGEAYDIILMDIQMPGMDGHAAARELRRCGYEGPIIALTAHAMERDREAALEAGCNDHCTKPIDRHQLVAAILTQVARQNAPQKRA
ncbi:response regulator [bacterium]|nr:response regulator [bacterium]